MQQDGKKTVETVCFLPVKEYYVICERRSAMEFLILIGIGVLVRLISTGVIAAITKILDHRRSPPLA